jgi:hypothetical protein
MICPFCKVDIKIFSSAWQSQRALPSRHCPSCKRTVEPALNGGRVAACMLVAVVVAGGLLGAMGMPWPVAIFFGLMLGAVGAVCFGMELAAPLAERKGLRGSLYKSRSLPGGLKGAWMSALGRGIAALFTAVACSGAVLSYCPHPWAGLLLTVLGAAGAWKRVFITAAFFSSGRIPQLASGVVLLAGLGALWRGFHGGV